MHTASERILRERIDVFMARKAREYPELKYLGKWDKYEVWPKRPTIGPRTVKLV